MKSQGLLSIAVLGVGNVVGTVISAIALILFSRFMGPSEFGIFSAAFAAMQLAVRFTDMGFNLASERAITRVYHLDQQAADSLMRVSFWQKIISSVVIFVLGWIFAPFLAQNILHIDNYTTIRIALLLSAGTVFFEYTTIISQATGNFGRVAWITMAQAVGKLLFGILLIWQHALTAMSGLLVYGFMPFVGALTVWKKSPFRSYTLPTSWKKELYALTGVAKWAAVAAISASLADNIDILFVQSFMSSHDTGIWSAAVRIATFASVLGWSIGSVLSNRVAKYHDKSHLDAYLQKSWKLALGSLLLTLVAIPFSKIAIWLTVGPAYFAATVPLQILLISAAIGTATSPFTSLFYLFDKPKFYAISGILQTAILLIGDYYLIPALGLLGAAWVRIVVKVFILVFTLLYAHRAYNEKYA